MNLRTALTTFLDNRKWEEAWNCVTILWQERDYKAVLKFREKIKKGLFGSERCMELYKRSYFLTARDVFDDYMLAIEWDRPAEQQYWLPRREKLLHICNYLQDLEEGRMNELFLSLPPRTGKTTMILFFLTWVILRNPEMSNLYSSYSDTVVKTFYKGALEILEDPYTYKWREVFPEREIARTDAANYLIDIDRSKHYASFTARSLYGSLNGSCDCNGYLICDDLHSGIEEALNPDLMKTAWFKVENNLLPRGKDAKTNKLLWIGTRWSLQDCIARRIDLLENEKEFEDYIYRVVNIPALDEDDESNFDYLYGVGFSTKYYRRRRASFERGDDLASWLAQYMGEPIERAGTAFEPSDFQYYNGVLPEGEPDRVFMACDPAWGGGDFVSAPLCYQYGDLAYVDEVVFSKAGKDITQPMIANMAIKHKANAMRIESTKTTMSYVDGVKESLGAYRMNIITATTKNKSKVDRILAAAPDIKAHFVFRDSGSRDKMYSMFMQNIFSWKYEGKVKNDDAPDSMAIACNFMVEGEARAVIQARPF